MGTKTNPNILRLGKTQEWQSKYIAKKSAESPTLVFKDLEIQKFIYQFFLKNNLQIQSCKLGYSENSLHLYILYYSLAKSPFIKKKIKARNKKVVTKSFIKKFKKIKKVCTKTQFYHTKAYQKNFTTAKKSTLLRIYYFMLQKTNRLKAIKHFKTYLDEKTHQTLKQKNFNLFVSKILKVLNLFTDKKHNIFLNLKQINNETNLLQKNQKKEKRSLAKNLTKLRKFQQNEFFKKGINFLYNSTTTQQNPQFLAKFITIYLKKIKRPNFFLRFLKIALKILINKKQLSKLQRIKIKITGRFNGAPRSNHKFIYIGKNIPVLNLNSRINYGESTAYTSNGTFGVKVWTYSLF